MSLKSMLRRKKAKLKRECITKYGDFAGLYKSPRGISYFALYVPNLNIIKLEVETTSNGWKLIENSDFRIVNVANLRIPVIRQAIVAATKLAEKNQLSQEQLEICLDYLFAELNKRINKRARI